MQNLKDIIEKVKKEAKENFVPIVRDKTLEFLIETIKSSSGKKVLEIGTATGYSALNMLLIDEVNVTTIEKNEDRYNEAKDNFKNADVEKRVTQILGDAGEELENLLSRNEKYDLVFLDGPKGQYIKYLPIIEKLLNENGILFADNILLGGLLKDATLINHKNRTMVRNMTKFLQELSLSKTFQTQIYEIEDGFVVSKFVNNNEK